VEFDDEARDVPRMERRIDIDVDGEYLMVLDMVLMFGLMPPKVEKLVEGLK
jgi:hypothetical protein